MVSNPIGSESAIVTLPGTMPPMPAVARVLAQFDRDKIGNAIEVMIALLDLAEPDPEAEGSTWPDDLRAVDRLHLPDDSEDDDPDTGLEDDPQGFDPEEDCCAAGDDCARSGSVTRAGLVCEDLGPGDADDAEREQMQDDVDL